VQQDWTTAYEIPTTGLTAGFHWIRLEHFEDTGNARIKLEWQQGTGTRSVIPVGNLYSVFPGLDSCPAPGSAALNPNSPQALAPLCQVASPTPTLTPTPSPTPTGTAEPFEVWHVSCNVNGGVARARNFPSFGGQFIRMYPAGTTLFVFESRVGADGTTWKRVTGYEQASYSGYSHTLWIAQNYQGIILEQGQASACSQLTPVSNNSITPQPTATQVYISVPVCADLQPGYNCPITSSSTDVEVVTFVLACESGNDILEAIDIAFAIRNRMKSGLFTGTARQVVSAGSLQSGVYTYQFQPYGQGCPAPISPLTSIGSLAELLVTQANNLPNNNLPGFSPGIGSTLAGMRWYSLYFVGIAINPATTTMTPSTVINLMIQQIPSCSPQQPAYIGYSPFGANLPSYTTVHFSDDPGCG
jgi:hypothetical protein